MTHNPRVSRAEIRCDLDIITNAKEDRGESRETLGIVDRFSKTKGETILPASHGGIRRTFCDGLADLFGCT